MSRSFLKLKKGQKKVEPLSVSTGIQRETSVSSRQTETGTPSVCRLLRRLNECPIVVFKKAMCEADLTGLIVSGSPTNEQLLEAWNEIFFDYAASIHTDNSDYLFTLAKDIGLKRHHIVYVEYAVYLLRFRHEPEVVQELIDMGYFHLQYTDDSENWTTQLNRVISLCKTVVFDLTEMEREYERLSKTTDGKRQSVDDFNQTVQQLARYQHYRIDQMTTMMDEYISILNNMLSESKAMERLNNGRKKN